MFDRHDTALCVLIPAYEPGEALADLVRELRVRELPVFVVNDGSSPAAAPHFAALDDLDGVYRIDHHANRGKGAALKTGMGILARRGFTHVITADADGQHLPRDIESVARAVVDHPESLVIGVRDIASMPPRSRAGNTVTRLLTHVVSGVRVTETQTGLRGIPLARIEELLSLPGDGYEFEMEMLLQSRSLFDGLVEIPVETVYENNNAGSHFKTVRDGVRVARVLLRMLPNYTVVSLMSFALDYAMFVLFSTIFGLWVVFSNVAARVISATFNYLCNRNYVFRVDGREYTPFRYLLLASGVLIVNSALVWLLVDMVGLPPLLVKPPVEFALFLVGFLVQSHLASRDTLQDQSALPEGARAADDASAWAIISR